MFFRFFDRTSVSRDRDCYGLTKISEILGSRQRFGMRQRFDHFEHGGPVQTGRYSTGENPPIKAGHRGTIPHLESTCTQFNTSARRRTRPSAGPERSQLLQILLSLTVRQLFSGPACFSCCANIGGRLVFSMRQSFCRRQCFWKHQGWHPPRLLDVPMFLYPPRFLDAPMFLYPQRFLDSPMFLYIFSGTYIFVYFTCILI